MPRVIDNFQTYLRELRLDDLKGPPACIDYEKSCWSGSMWQRRREDQGRSLQGDVGSVAVHKVRGRKEKLHSMTTPGDDDLEQDALAAETELPRRRRWRWRRDQDELAAEWEAMVGGEDKDAGGDRPRVHACSQSGRNR